MTAATPLNHGAHSTADYQLHFFSALIDRPVAVSRPDLKIGTLSDLVFKLAEPFPEAVGIVVGHKRGLPNEFVPWDRVTRIDANAIVVMPPEHEDRYPAFVDQPGWILLNEHLIGRTILDMDGRKVELVNDVHLLASHGRMIIAHVDVSLNGFLRKWGLGLLANDGLADPAAAHYFAETGHAIGSQFWGFWSTHGLEFDGNKNAKSFNESLALFGMPVSEPQMEQSSDGNMYMTQWFERARFEFHPENAGTEYEVLLGLLGRELTGTK